MEEVREEWCRTMAEVLTIKDVSKVLQVSVGRARELIGSGRIPKIPGLSPRTIRVSREALEAFIEANAGK